MAEQILAKFEAIQNSSDPRKKALVIMNYRHAFPHIEVTRGSRTKRFQNTAGFLMEARPDNVANVMLNSIRILPGSTDSKVSMSAIQNGKWDAAFAALGNPDVGFDFDSSPFGEDAFDYFPIPTGNKYKDVFTGFVFYKPLQEHKCAMGIPGLFDGGFAIEMQRRYMIIDEVRKPEEIRKEIAQLKKVLEFGYDSEEYFGKSNLKQEITKWLKGNGTGN
jgi:hypothetical protein